MDSKVIDYSLFLGLSVDNTVTKQMTITHNKFMKREDVSTDELYIYCMGLCSMAKHLLTAKPLVSTLAPQWHIRDMSCNCYLFEVIMRCNQYMARVVDLLQEDKEFHAYLSATSGCGIANKAVCDIKVPEKHCSLIVAMQQALGVGYFITKRCIPAWTDIPTGYIDDDIKESIEYYSFIRAVLLLHGTCLLIADKPVAASAAWTAHLLLRDKCPTIASGWRASLVTQSNTTAISIHAKVQYSRGAFEKGVLLLRQVTSEGILGEWATLMLKTKVPPSTTSITLDKLMEECSSSDKMIMGIDPSISTIFTDNIAVSSASKATRT
jgi:hypothetical protein